MVIFEKVLDTRGMRKWARVAVVIAMASAGLGNQVATASTAAPDGSPNRAFVDPLDAPALMRTSVAGRPVMSVVGAGRRLVVVGMRGLIAISDDGGKTWTQASVPAQSDLLALSFPTNLEGWAVGHDGVVLHSGDGGATWSRQLDGRVAARRLSAIYQQKVAAGDQSVQPYLDQLNLNYKSGPTLPFVSVAFENARMGFAVGSFGMIVATEDGGKTWQPYLDRIDDPQFLHLNSIRYIEGNLYIAAEKGTVFKFDRQSGRFVAATTGYPGSFFGIVGNAKVLLAHGLRGTVYRSTDSGTTWTPTTVPMHGAITGAAYLPQRRVFVLVTSGGEIATGDEMGENFQSQVVGRPTVFTAVHGMGDSAVAVSGLDGTRILTLH
ncbi:WD40/YVTN/BNR-like repeat-containing protein [Paraburkholderia sp. GAS348]|jgi:photosystem II stability/assembly factor-like uncharacterized protein|uniref:WD40/YVTN/BNR-like repeat-containing protein n=1 Tax=Paraburkholderia sp. GAS348 TaxID=3035132 RepID=UPI003D2377E0